MCRDTFAIWIFSEYKSLWYYSAIPETQVFMGLYWGFPGGANGKEPACQCRRFKRLELDTWVGKIPWRRVWQPTPVYLPRESPRTEEPGRPQSLESQRVRHDWATKHSTAQSSFILTITTRRKGLPTLLQKGPSPCQATTQRKYISSEWIAFY